MEPHPEGLPDDSPWFLHLLSVVWFEVRFPSLDASNQQAGIPANNKTINKK